jgi:hypothetical protein
MSPFASHTTSQRARLTPYALLESRTSRPCARRTFPLSHFLTFSLSHFLTFPPVSARVRGQRSRGRCRPAYRGKPIDRTDANTYSTRTVVASMPKKSASPEHTPAIWRFRILRRNGRDTSMSILTLKECAIQGPETQRPAPSTGPPHVLTFPPSHLRTLAPSRPLTFLRSNSLTFSPSHLLTFSLSHFLTFSPSHPSDAALCCSRTRRSASSNASSASAMAPRSICSQTCITVSPASLRPVAPSSTSAPSLRISSRRSW